MEVLHGFDELPRGLGDGLVVVLGATGDWSGEAPWRDDFHPRRLLGALFEEIGRKGVGRPNLLTTNYDDLIESALREHSDRPDPSVLLEMAASVGVNDRNRLIERVERAAELASAVALVERAGSNDLAPSTSSVETSVDILNDLLRVLVLAVLVARSRDRSGWIRDARAADVRLDLRVEPRDSQAPPAVLIEVGDQGMQVMSSP